MWHLDHELVRWFDKVEADRADRSSGGGGHAAEERTMMTNALAKQWRKGR